jgi:hypothetical protein
VVHRCRVAGCAGDAIYAHLVADSQGFSRDGAGIWARGAAENCIGVTLHGLVGLYAGLTAADCRGINGSITATAPETPPPDLAVGAFSHRADTAHSRSLPAPIFPATARHRAPTAHSGPIAASGLFASIVDGCCGVNWSTAPGTYGLYATTSASNSTGSGALGLYAARAAHYCAGSSTVLGGTALLVGHEEGGAAIGFIPTGPGEIRAGRKHATV